MTENKSLSLYARLAARLEDFMSLHGLPSALFGIYTCVVLSLLFILCVLCAVKNKFTLPYLNASKYKLKIKFYKIWWYQNGGPPSNGADIIQTF